MALYLQLVIKSTSCLVLRYSGLIDRAALLWAFGVAGLCTKSTLDWLQSKIFLILDDVYILSVACAVVQTTTVLRRATTSSSELVLAV